MSKLMSPFCLFLSLILLLAPFRSVFFSTLASWARVAVSSREPAGDGAPVVVPLSTTPCGTGSSQHLGQTQLSRVLPQNTRHPPELSAGRASSSELLPPGQPVTLGHSLSLQNQSQRWSQISALMLCSAGCLVCLSRCCLWNFYGCYRI